MTKVEGLVSMAQVLVLFRREHSANPDAPINPQMIIRAVSELASSVDADMTERQHAVDELRQRMCEK